MVKKMKTIYKYPIKIDNNGVCIVDLPKNSQILKVTKFHNQQVFEVLI